MSKYNHSFRVCAIPDNLGAVIVPNARTQVPSIRRLLISRLDLFVNFLTNRIVIMMRILRCKIPLLLSSLRIQLPFPQIPAYLLYLISGRCPAAPEPFVGICERQSREISVKRHIIYNRKSRWKMKLMDVVFRPRMGGQSSK